MREIKASEKSNTNIELTFRCNELYTYHNKYGIYVNKIEKQIVIHT